MSNLLYKKAVNAEMEEELDMLEEARDSTLDKAITGLKYFSADE